MDKNKLEILRILDHAVTILQAKPKLNDTDRAIYTDLLMAREKIQQSNSNLNWGTIMMVLTNLLNHYK